MASLLINRQQLAFRWGCSTRKIDRLRKAGLLSWIDLTCGEGQRPIVRFSENLVAEFERKSLMDIRQQKEEK